MNDALWLCVLFGYYDMCINKDSLLELICFSVSIFVPDLDGSP